MRFATKSLVCLSFILVRATYYDIPLSVCYERRVCRTMILPCPQLVVFFSVKVRRMFTLT